MRGSATRRDEPTRSVRSCRTSHDPADGRMVHRRGSRGCHTVWERRNAFIFGALDDAPLPWDQALNVNQESARASIRNAYPWLGDPRLAKFSVYLDGRLQARLLPGTSTEISASPGEHCLHVAWHWNRSPDFVWLANPGERIDLDATIDMSASVWARMMKLLFHPRSALILRVRKDGAT